MKSRMRTGELAAAAGMKTTAVRYYERRGLLPVPVRSSAGYRLYPPEALTTLEFIRRAKNLGFTLREIKALLEGRGDTSACSILCALAERKARSLRTSAQRAERAERTLLHLLEQRPARGRKLRECPVARYLEGGRGPKRGS